MPRDSERVVVWDLRRWRRERKSEERVEGGRGGEEEGGGGGRRRACRVRVRAVRRSEI